MKRLSIHHVVFGILLSCLTCCINENDDDRISSEKELEEFFSYHPKGYSASRNGSYDLSDKGISCVINTLCTREDILWFVRMFKTDYGQPLWDNSVFISGEDRYILYVPVVNKKISPEIQTIWTFHIKGDTLSHYPFVRNPNAQYVEEYWKYDYFTTYALGVEPASGLRFKESRSGDLPEIKCVHAFVEVEESVDDKGIHCWWDKGSGHGDLPPEPNFPDQPIPEEDIFDGPGGNNNDSPDE